MVMKFLLIVILRVVRNASMVVAHRATVAASLTSRKVSQGPIETVSPETVGGTIVPRCVNGSERKGFFMNYSLYNVGWQGWV